MCISIQLRVIRIVVLSPNTVFVPLGEGGSLNFGLEKKNNLQGTQMQAKGREQCHDFS